LTTEQGDETFESTGVFIQNEPYRLAIYQGDVAIFIPWERVVAFAVEGVDTEAPAEPE
jgi:hypothetical protein